MNKFLFLFVGLAAASASFADSGAEAFIKKGHTAFENAMVANDSKAAKKVVVDYFAPSFTYTQLKGAKQNRQSFMAQMTPTPGVRFTAFKFSYGPFTQKGNTITVAVSTKIKATMKDQKGKAHTMEGAGTDTETWVKSGSGWKMTSMVERSSKQTMDGKPFGG